MPERINCLLIEDDINDVNVFIRFAEINGLDYEISHASTLSAAIEKIGSGTVDVIVTDISFSDGSIYMLLSQVKDTPIIVVTAEGEEELASKILQMGAADYIIKDMKRNYLEAVPPAINKARQNYKNQTISNAFIDTLASMNQEICVFNSFGEIMFATEKFRTRFGLTDGAFLINIKKLLKNVLAKQVDNIHEADFNELLKDELNFHMKLKGDKRKLAIKLVPIRDNHGDLLGYIWMEQKDFHESTNENNDVDNVSD